MATYEDEVLLLRPDGWSVDVAAIEAHVAATPGAFRDPLDAATWILSAHPELVERLRRERVAHPTRYPELGLARVTISPDYLVVYPDSTTGRARQLVTWLLSRGTWELTVRGHVVGRVTAPLEIYGDEPWEDPDAGADPTESPPRTGSLLTFERDRAGTYEQLAVHDSGVLSYERMVSGGGREKLYRQLVPEMRARWNTLVSQLPLDADVPGPDGSFVDPVLLRVETPSDLVAMPKIDAARPTEPYREIVALANGWTAALRADQTAVPSGLRMLDPG